MKNKKFSWSEAPRPLIVLAPMANITNPPFRSICKKMGADIVFTPMFSANAIVYNPKITLPLIATVSSEQPVIVQIFGYDGDMIAKAARIIDQKLAPAGIDINMGCPAPKVTGNESGSALLRDYKRALEIAKTVRKAYTGQLSIKVRLGWSEYDVLPFILELEKIGIDAVSVHGRTAKQGYKGIADWSAIKEIASKTKIPIIGNGDITSNDEAISALNSNGVAGIMIGRGSLGNPWVFKEVSTGIAFRPSKKELIETILEQTKLTVDYLGDEDRAVREMRKHLGWYLKNFNTTKEIRSRAVRVNSVDDIRAIISEI